MCIRVISLLQTVEVDECTLTHQHSLKFTQVSLRT